MKKLSKQMICPVTRNDAIDVSNSLNILQKPGDRLSARVTPSNRKVLTIETNGGSTKYSATQYPNGTIVETKSTKTK